MADAQASRILHQADMVFGRVTLAKKTAADDIQIGDLLISDGANGVEKMSADTEDATFVGIAAMMSKDADGPQNILIYNKCIIEMPVTSAAYAFGAGLKWVTAGMVADGAANTIAWAWETKGTTTSLKVLVDVPALAKLLAVSA